MKNQFLLKASIIFLLLCSVNALSQSIPRDNPLEPSKPSMPDEFGIIAAIGQNFSGGNITVECPECLFEDAVGTSFLLGFVYDYTLDNYFRIGAMASFLNKSVTSSYTEIENHSILSDVTKKYMDVPLTFNHEYVSDIMYFAVSPYVKFYPMSFIYIKTSFDIGFNIKGHYVHNKILTDKNIQLPDGQVAELKTDKSEISNKNIENLNSTMFSISPSLGFDFKFAGNVYMSPFFMYNIMLTPVSNSNEKYNINSWYLGFELRYRLNQN